MTFSLGETVMAYRDTDTSGDELMLAGEEVTIVGVLMPRKFGETHGYRVFDAYLVSHPGHPGHTFRAKPNWLRKLPPMNYEFRPAESELAPRGRR